jgi:hypothetical protein
LSGGGGKPFIQPIASTEVAAGSGGAAGAGVWAFEEVFTAISVKAATSAVRWKKDMGFVAPVGFIFNLLVNGR